MPESTSLRSFFFRIVFGLVNAGLVVRVLWQHLVGPWWASAPFLFKYAGFSWVKPWPGIWLQFHWIALGVFAFFIAIGFLYRISTVLFFLSHTYFFLLSLSSSRPTTRSRSMPGSIRSCAHKPSPLGDFGCFAFRWPRFIFLPASQN
ncbi:MAG: hypothetical protein DME32_04600 [Verrucomicrobia bacterium]|nr:MAG: hypothetical protein DME32_04600 [Verrucomicrobiota bacterium]